MLLSLINFDESSSIFIALNCCVVSRLFTHYKCIYIHCKMSALWSSPLSQPLPPTAPQFQLEFSRFSLLFCTPALDLALALGISSI